MQNYDEIIRETIGGFCSPQDLVVCRYVFKKPNQTCYMCGKHPITWNYVLHNVESGDKLVVGSECVVNLSLVVGKPLVFSQEYEYAVRFINNRFPGAAIVADWDLLETLSHLDWQMGLYAGFDEHTRRQWYDDLVLDPDDPNVWELAPDDLDPMQIDWESLDYE